MSEQQPLTGEALRIQVLRSIDKIDRVGLRGVYDRLTSGCLDASGSWVEGVGLPSSKALFLVAFLCAGETTGERGLVANRFRLMEILEETILNDEGYTAWDALIDMPTNADDTWSEGRRPNNIAWALDDIVRWARSTKENRDA